MASMANSWDTRLGGALADAVTCNAVVKAFGAEDREDERLSSVTRKWQDRTRRTWTRGTLNGTSQNALLSLLRGCVLGLALWLWANGKANAGDITFVLTAFFITRRWAQRGTRPSAPHDQRTLWAYIFGSICPKKGKGAGIVMPWCDTQAMNAHLMAISGEVDPGARAPDP